MEENELVWLAQQATNHQCIVEVGSYLGRSTRALADAAPGVVYAVDDWLGPRDVYLPREIRGNLFNQFCDNLSDLLETGKVILIRTDHARVVLEAHPDMVFIDGDHAEPTLRRDIRLWQPRLLDQGLLCGHDAGHFGVDQVVSDLLGAYEVADDTTIWWKIKHG